MTNNKRHNIEHQTLSKSPCIASIPSKTQMFSFRMFCNLYFSLNYKMTIHKKNLSFIYYTCFIVHYKYFLGGMGYLTCSTVIFLLCYDYVCKYITANFVVAICINKENFNHRLHSQYSIKIQNISTHELAYF